MESSSWEYFPNLREEEQSCGEAARRGTPCAEPKHGDRSIRAGGTRVGPARLRGPWGPGSAAWPLLSSPRCRAWDEAGA